MPATLLALHALVAEKLRDCGITRGSNNPTGNLAEHLLCSAFGWKQAGNSNANLDAVGAATSGKGQGLTGSVSNRRGLGLDTPTQAGALLPKIGTFRANTAGGRAILPAIASFS
jgi:hypothetical protein